MSIGSLITGGLGVFSTIPLLLLEGLGNFPAGANIGAGGIDWENWAEPPEGYRRVLDTRGIDIAARREALLNDARREIGLLRDPEPIQDIEEIKEADVQPVAKAVEAVPPVEISLPPPDPAIAIAILKVERELLAAEIEAEKVEWIRRDNEAVLLLVAGA